MWQGIEPLLRSQPQIRSISLNPPCLFQRRSGGLDRFLSEFIIVDGSSEVLDPPDPLKLFGLELLAERTIPGNGHEGPIEFAGYVQGITPEAGDRTRTIAIMFTWVSEDKRARFVDPEQHSYWGYGDDEYDQAVGAPLRDLEGRGATVESYLCRLQKWFSPLKPAKRQRCCAIM